MLLNFADLNVPKYYIHFEHFGCLTLEFREALHSAALN